MYVDDDGEILLIRQRGLLARSDGSRPVAASGLLR